MATIMVIDDEPDIVFLVEKMLKKEGYDVMHAYSGEEGLKKLEKVKPDLILLDVMMPGINGWETSKKIKENPKLRSIPIAILSVKSTDEDMEQSFQFGHSDAHIPKPIIRKKMLSTVKWLLENVPKAGVKE
jgi:CheY-like chemotaxis protein